MMLTTAPQLSAERGILSRERNLPVAIEFSRNSVLAGDIGDKFGLFGLVSGTHTVCIHDFAMKYTTATQALMGGILKILS